MLALTSRTTNTAGWCFSVYHELLPIASDLEGEGPRGVEQVEAPCYKEPYLPFVVLVCEEEVKSLAKVSEGNMVPSLLKHLPEARETSGGESDLERSHR